MPFETTASTDEAVAQMKRHLSGFETEEGRRSGLAFAPTSNDIVIVTTPKAGTTFMQNVCHQLRAVGGDLGETFHEIGEAAPWIELASDLGQDLKAPQAPHGAPPRLFKSHCWHDHCPGAVARDTGAKYIVVLREPHAVATSFFSFFQGWFFEEGAVSVDAFVREFVLARGAPDTEMENASYWHHLLSWWPRRRDPDVLVVFYEDMLEDLEGEVTRVADFMGYGKGGCLESETRGPGRSFEERVAVSVKNSSMAAMRDHATLFDEHMTKDARNEACGLPQSAGRGGGKVRAAGAARPTMSEETKAMMDAKWTEVLGEATGCATYAKLREVARAER